MDSLLGKMTPSSFKKTLNSLESGTDGSAYAKAYDNAMERIGQQADESKRFAYSAVSWVIRARTRLTTSQLQDALAVEVGEQTFDNERLPYIEDVVSCCAGLLIIDQQSKLAGLVHATAQEYFEQNWATWFPKAEELIARSCLTYLTRDEFALPLRLLDTVS